MKNLMGSRRSLPECVRSSQSIVYFRGSVVETTVFHDGTGDPRRSTVRGHGKEGPSRRRRSGTTTVIHSTNTDVGHEEDGP